MKKKINPKAIVNVGLNHGNNIYWTEKGDRGKGALDKETIISNHDGLVSSDRNVFLMVTIADCFPVFYYDPINCCIGLVHAGWRGILKGIVEKPIEIMKKNSGSNSNKIAVFIGPGIHSCHFEVSDDIANQFEERFESNIVDNTKNRKFVDLTVAIKYQLELSGIKPNNIEIAPECTYCSDSMLSSYRRDKDDYVAQAAIIGMI